MENKYVITAEGVIVTPDELRHWGIKGMKWGLRRYQNPDGSLTPAGRKRYAAETAALKKRETEIKGREKAAARQAKLDKKRAELDARENALKKGEVAKKSQHTNVNKHKTVADMTDEELRNETNRMRLESDYHNAKKSLAAANPKEVSAGKRFVDGLINDVVIPAGKNAGKAWLEDYLKNSLGLNKPDKLARLKKQHETFEYEKKIKDLKKTDDEINKLKKEHEKLDYEKKISELKTPKKKEPTAEEQNKIDTHIQNHYKTEKARRDWEAYQRDIVNLGEEEAWKLYVEKQKQGGN